MQDEAALGVQVAERMQAGNEIVGVAEAVERDLAHAGHDAHAGDDVGAVGDFDAELAVGRICRAEDVGHDVHRAALHGAVEERADFGFASSGAIQLLVGPASSWLRVQMKVTLSVRATSLGLLRCR